MINQILLLEIRLQLDIFFKKPIKSQDFSLFFLNTLILLDFKIHAIVIMFYRIISFFLLFILEIFFLIFYYNKIDLNVN